VRRHVIRALVLACCPGALAHCGGGAVPTRASVEADEDKFCRAVARARVLENEYGLNPVAPAPDGGEAGSK